MNAPSAPLESRELDILSSIANSMLSSTTPYFFWRDLSVPVSGLRFPLRAPARPPVAGRPCPALMRMAGAEALQ
jgi:hypothetical protein